LVLSFSVSISIQRNDGEIRRPALNHDRNVLERRGRFSGPCQQPLAFATTKQQIHFA